MMGDKIKRRINELKAVKKAREYIIAFQEHEKRAYPYSEEDEEGIITHISPHQIEMTFKGITLEEGCKRTINIFKWMSKIHKVSIMLEGEKIVVTF